MVSAAKYSRAERELKPARVYGTGAKAVFEAAELEQDESKPNHLLICISSDRGLCGGIHSGVAKGVNMRGHFEKHCPQFLYFLVFLG